MTSAPALIILDKVQGLLLFQVFVRVILPGDAGS